MNRVISSVATLTIDGHTFEIVSFDRDNESALVREEIADRVLSLGAVAITMTADAIEIERLADWCRDKYAMAVPCEYAEPRRRRAQWKDEQSQYGRRKGR